MNRIDRSSDNWYEGGDSEELSVDPDIYFDEPPVEIKHHILKYSDADMVKLLYVIFGLNMVEFKLLRYRILSPQYSLETIGREINEVKASVLKKMRLLCKKHPIFAPMFSRYKLEKKEENENARD